MKNLIILSFLLFETSFCYKILVVFPFPRKSHQILGEGYVRHLLAARHEVTYITTAPIKSSHPKLREIEVTPVLDSSLAERYNLKTYLTGTEAFGGFTVQRDVALIPPQEFVIFHKDVQELIRDPAEQFDVVIAEWLFVDLAGAGLAAVFNCPLIWSTSMETINPVLGMPHSYSHPAYSSSELPDSDPSFTFWRRMVELYKFCRYQVYLWLSSRLEEDMYKKAFADAVAKRGRVLPPYHEARHNASLVLANSCAFTGGVAMTLSQNYKQIGGYHLEDIVKPLPENLQNIMDDSEHGVIYLSLGSIMQTKDTPEIIKAALMKVFGDLKQTVIMKFDASFSEVPKNVHVMKWAPQLSILAHKNCVLFITHGGQLSLIEAVHSAVPIIGIPLIIDQFLNVDRAVVKGFGRRVTASMDLARDLEVAIRDVLGNSSYAEKAREYSAIYSHRLASPGEELVFWTEHVVRTRGAPHLRPPATRAPLYQKMYLDLLLLVVIFYGIYKGVRLLWHVRGRKLKIA